MKNNKLLFYVLSFTWGLPMTLVGVVAAAVMLLLFRKPELCGYCIRFRIGNGWGGVSLGLTIITDNQSESEITYHEHGHAIQNTLYGFFMPFLVCIPSMIRYWYREYLVRIKGYRYSSLPAYDDVWYEGQATRWGTEFMVNLGRFKS